MDGKDHVEETGGPDDVDGDARATRQAGNASQGTQEREERITGSVGVKNRKGEVVHQGSTTSPKGAAGIGRPDQEAPGEE